MTDSELLGLPFDQYQRYKLLAQIIEAVLPKGERGPLLEVGGYPVKIHRFLPDDEIYVIDQEGRSAEAGDQGPGTGDKVSRLPPPVSESYSLYSRGDGRHLPFADKQFDIVVSLDVLEHIAPGDRPAFLAELERCARRMVILAAPFQNSAARDAERVIFEFIQARGGYEHVFFREHLELPSPVLFETEMYFISQNYHTLILPNGRLDRWLLMMSVYYYLDTMPNAGELLRRVMAFYNEHFYPADNAEPAYRYFIVALRDEPGARFSRLAESVTGPALSSLDLSPIKAIIEGLRLDAERSREQRIAELEDMLRVKDEELAGLKEHLARLEDFAARVKALPLYRFYTRFIKRKGG